MSDVWVQVDGLLGRRRARLLSGARSARKCTVWTKRKTLLCSPIPFVVEILLIRIQVKDAILLLSPKLPKQSLFHCHQSALIHLASPEEVELPFDEPRIDLGFERGPLDKPVIVVPLIISNGTRKGRRLL